jgi:hypothetical protein
MIYELETMRGFEQALRELEDSDYSPNNHPVGKFGFCPACNDITSYTDSAVDEDVVEVRCSACNNTFWSRERTANRTGRVGGHSCAGCYLVGVSNEGIPPLAREKLRKLYEPKRQRELLLERLQIVLARKKTELNDRTLREEVKALSVLEKKLQRKTVRSA